MSTIKSSAEHLTLNADGASKDIKFQANGVEKASIDSSGNLTVSGNLTSVGIDDNADATAMTITSDEKIGIGTTIPQKLLDITDSSSGESIPLVISNRDTTSGTGQKVTLGFGLARDGGALKPEAGTIEVGREAAWNTDATVDSYMAFSTYLNNSATEKLRITSSGNVGIGTDSPDSSLEIYKSSTAELMIGSDNGGTAQISLYESNSTTKEATIKYDGLANNLVIGTSGEANAIVIPRDTGYVTMPSQPSFRVGGHNGESGAGTVVKHATFYHNTGSHYSSSTGRFTAPVAGSYFFGVKIISALATTSTEQNIKIVKNGSTTLDARFQGYTESSTHPTIVLDLAAGDYVNISTANSNTDIYAGAVHNQFYGYLIG